MSGARLHGVGAYCGLVISVLVSAGNLQAEIRLPHLLSEHAVLQRDRPIHIWGWSDPGETVDVAFHQQKLHLVANDLGEFSGWLAPEKAGGPFSLTINGGKAEAAVTVGDLLVGDVWFASGQSNMEMPLKGFAGQAVVKNSESEIAASAHPELRLLRFEHNASAFPVEDITATWTRCDPASAADFSAVAYFFGREIAQGEHVPVGLIDSTWGGTPVDSWMSLNSIAANASLMPVFASRARFAAGQTALQRTIDRDKRNDAAARARHETPPQHPWHPDERSWNPSVLYNGMVAPATPYTVRGFLWYQGESDSTPERSPMYARLFPAMIEDWREQWGEGALPFLFVQISSVDSPSEIWGAIREAQRRTLSVANTAMAVSLDVGEAKNVHPPDKQTVGHRLALGARRLSYGEDLEWSGPMYREATSEGSGARVWFDHAGGGLRTRGLDRAGPVLGFELAGDDGHFVPASATLHGDTVLVQAAGLGHPRLVRYAWANLTGANLENREALPASTFLGPVR